MQEKDRNLLGQKGCFFAFTCGCWCSSEASACGGLWLWLVKMETAHLVMRFKCLPERGEILWGGSAPHTPKMPTAQPSSCQQIGGLHASPQPWPPPALCSLDVALAGWAWLVESQPSHLWHQWRAGQRPPGVARGYHS